MKVERTYTTSIAYWQRKGNERNRIKIIPLILNKLLDYIEDIEDLDFLQKSKLKHIRTPISRANWKKRIEISVDPYFSRIYASKYKNGIRKSKMHERKADEEEVLDDDEPENDEDDADEDIIIEEDNDFQVTTEENVEKSEVLAKQMDYLKNNTLHEALKLEMDQDTKSNKNDSINFGVPYKLIILLLMINRLRL